MNFNYHADSHIKKITDMRIAYPADYNPTTGDGKYRSTQSMALNGKKAYVIKLARKQEKTDVDGTTYIDYNKAAIYVVDDYVNTVSVSESGKKVTIGDSILFHANGAAYHNGYLYVARLDSAHPDKYQIVKVNPEATTQSTAIQAGYKVSGVSGNSRVVRAITSCGDNKFIIMTNKGSGNAFECILGSLEESSTADKMDGIFRVEKTFYIRNLSGYVKQDIFYDDISGTLYLVTNDQTVKTIRNNCVLEYDLGDEAITDTIQVGGVNYPLYVPINKIFIDIPSTLYRAFEMESMAVDRNVRTTDNYNPEKKIVVATSYADTGSTPNASRQGAIFALTNIRCHM